MEEAGKKSTKTEKEEKFNVEYNGDAERFIRNSKQEQEKCHRRERREIHKKSIKEKGRGRSKAVKEKLGKKNECDCSERDKERQGETEGGRPDPDD